MAQVVGVFAASHMPPIVHKWEHVDGARRAEVSAGYEEMGRRLVASQPDVLVMIGPDHLQNFFFDNFPAVCIGIGEEHLGPAEPWMKPVPEKYAGHRALGEHIAKTAFASDFEPATSRQFRLDHGFIIPLRFGKVERIPPIVPIVINTVELPMPSVRRCDAWGALVTKAIASFPGKARVAVIAHGGLSHSIGEPTMGEIDLEFDSGFMTRLGAPDTEELIRFTEERIGFAGNGAQESRHWVAARAAARACNPAARFDRIFYRAIPEWYTGLCIASWGLEAGAPT